MDHTVEIVTSREQSTMASCWTEYLCLVTASFGKCRLFTGPYEALAELGSYYNEETEEYELPDAIDGKAVHGFDDDYVIGGELGCFAGGEAVESGRLEEPQVAEWLDSSGWSTLTTLNDVSRVLKNSLSTSNVEA